MNQIFMTIFKILRKTGSSWAVLGLALLGTIFIGLKVKQNIDQEAIRQFAFARDQLTLKIIERLAAYALILCSGTALFGASISVA
jgi:hypothetical protein